jgi:uncharacterized protein YciU (UPF0263 family)
VAAHCGTTVLLLQPFAVKRAKLQTARGQTGHIMDLNNRLTEDETLEQAYDIFLELAGDNLDPADIILFNLQFEERGGAELFDPSEDWHEHVDFDVNPDFFSEVVIGLGDADGEPINDIFARVLLCREKDHKLCHILWRE